MLSEQQYWSNKMRRSRRGWQKHFSYEERCALGLVIVHNPHGELSCAVMQSLKGDVLLLAKALQGEVVPEMRIQKLVESIKRWQKRNKGA